MNFYLCRADYGGMEKKLEMAYGVVTAAALLKMLWSVVFSGEAGMSVLKPAVIGLLICIGVIYYYQKKHTVTKK